MNRENSEYQENPKNPEYTENPKNQENLKNPETPKKPEQVSRDYMGKVNNNFGLYKKPVPWLDCITSCRNSSIIQA